MLWAIFVVMLIAASVFVAWPIYRHHGKLSVVGASTVFAIIAISTGLYLKIGTPDADPAQPTVPDVAQMVASLDARLQKNPDDLEGWKMLGRSYLQIGNLPKAINAFETAIELEGFNNGATLVSLGEALLMQDQSSMAGRAGDLFENGLALASNNPQALFYGGLSALQRGNTALAADRWEALVALSPPPEVQDVLIKRIAEWRGEAPPDVAPEARLSVENDAVVTIDVQVGEIAAAAIDPSASVFIIARDPAQPSPPLAVTRRRAAELPDTVTIGDSDAMIPGRVPSAYTELEVVVRVSASGQPIASSGDWFGQRRIKPAEGSELTIVVDQQVP